MRDEVSPVNDTPLYRKTQGGVRSIADGLREKKFRLLSVVGPTCVSCRNLKWLKHLAALMVIRGGGKVDIIISQIGGCQWRTWKSPRTPTTKTLVSVPHLCWLVRDEAGDRKRPPVSEAGKEFQFFPAETKENFDWSEWESLLPRTTERMLFEAKGWGSCFSSHSFSVLLPLSLLLLFLPSLHYWLRPI